MTTITKSPEVETPETQTRPAPPPDTQPESLPPVPKKHNRKKEPREVYIESKLLQSKAYLSLAGKSAQVLAIFWCKKRMVNFGTTRKKKWQQINNGELVFTYTQAIGTYGIRQSTFTRALTELISKGFIDVAHPSTQLRGDVTLYAISDRWRDYATDRFEAATRPKGRSGMGFTKKFPTFTYEG